MSEYRIKMKIGDAEFEAVGPIDDVKAQFETFKEMVRARASSTEARPASEVPSVPASLTSMYDTAPDVDKCFHLKGRVVSLATYPAYVSKSDTESVLLILFGQNLLRKNPAVTGGEIVDGLGYESRRVREALRTLASERAITITGSHRGKRYLLTDKGTERARKLVRDLMARNEGKIRQIELRD
jgi:hypothetical protein